MVKANIRYDLIGRNVMQGKAKITVSIICTIFLFLHAIAYGHGFSADTLVQLDDGSLQTIHIVCLRSLHNKISVSSYNIDASCKTNQLVKVGRRSKSNCYVRLGFDFGFNDSMRNDIVCTPMQEFYMPATHKWVHAYTLKVGDALLTKDNSAKPITYIQFVQKSLTIYTLEIKKSHTFFVGNHSILTHNMLLPLAFNVGLSIPFGATAMGTAGSFFGPIGLIGGVVLGGIIGLTVKAMYEDHIPTYTVPEYDMDFINTHCYNVIHHVEQNNRMNNDELFSDIEQCSLRKKATGCFTPDLEENKPHIYVTPIEGPLLRKEIGCIGIDIEFIGNQIPKECGKDDTSERDIVSICFQPVEENNQTLHVQQKESVDEKKIRYQGPFAHNWKEFERDCPVGQKYGKKFVNTGKQNPKDRAPIRKLMEDIPNAEMFKKGYYFAPDRLHDGDHLEVWDKRGSWIGVANLDGSRNETKSNAEKNPEDRNIKDVI